MTIETPMTRRHRCPSYICEGRDRTFIVEDLLTADQRTLTVGSCPECGIMINLDIRTKVRLNNPVDNPERAGVAFPPAAANRSREGRRPARMPQAA